jgi:hypothetical protein
MSFSPLIYGIIQQKRHQFRLVFSVRLVVPDYTGYCMKVRRSSDNTTQDIGFVGGDLDTTSLLSFVGTGSGYVEKWYDQTGEGWDAYQSNTANQPRIVNAGTLETENSKPIINFGLKTDYWYLEIPTGFIYNIRILSIFLVAKIDEYGASNSGVLGPSTELNYGVGLIQFRIGSAANPCRAEIRYYTGSIFIPNDNVNAEYQLWLNNVLCFSSVFFTSPKIYAFRNGDAISLTTDESFKKLNFNGVYAIGRYSQNTGNYYLQGKIAELHINSLNETSSRETIESGIDTYYAITGSFDLEYVTLSLRKINSDYSGYCIKIRRSSDNTTQDIGFVGGDLDTTSLLSFVGTDSAYVHTWYDQSGKGNNATQTTNANQPRIVNAGTLETENSKPIINFGINTDAWFLRFSSGLLYDWRYLSCIMVAKLKTYTATMNNSVFGPETTYATGFQLVQGAGTSWTTILQINGTVRNANTGDSYKLWNDDVLSLTEVFCGSDNVTSAFKNGSAVSLTNTTDICTGIKFNGVYAIGKYANGYYMYGKVAELRFINGFRQSERSNIESDVNDFYSIY